MKVFLSHSVKDAEFVERLADALIAADFEPWLCEVDIEKSENIVAKIEEGLAQCDLALVVWSPDAATSNWTKEEWTSVLARQVAEQKIRLGIVLLREHPLPVVLQNKRHIDARSDQGTGLRETVKWLQPYIEFSHVSKSFDRPVLADYSFELYENETLAILGSPGSGKSLILRLIMGFEQSDSGE